MKIKNNGFYTNRVEVLSFEEFAKKYPHFWWGRLRFQLFRAKGFNCIRCGAKGFAIVLWKQKGGGTHTDVVCMRNDKEVMLTMDHTWPKSLGGKKTIDNLEPMCAPCNERKGNKVEQQPAELVA
jgi:5-methylcytosine-specific restriction endonuclease McrA